MIERQCKLRSIALLGYENIVFKKPVLAGDTLTVEMEVLGARPTGKPNRAILRMKLLARKQSGEVVMEMEESTLLEKIAEKTPA